MLPFWCYTWYSCFTTVNDFIWCRTWTLTFRECRLWVFGNQALNRIWRNPCSRCILGTVNLNAKLSNGGNITLSEIINFGSLTWGKILNCGTLNGDSALFWSNGVEVTGGWKKLRNKKLQSSYSSWRMRWAQRVAWRYIQNFKSEYLQWRDYLRNGGVDKRIILEQLLQKCGLCIGLSWPWG